MTEPCDRASTAQSDFADVYHNLNKLYADLVQLRETGGAIEDKARKLRMIELELRRRDALEASYGPYGLIPNPIYINGFAVDLEFCAPGSHKNSETRSSDSIRSMFSLI